jgi:hypothetical protein
MKSIVYVKFPKAGLGNLLLVWSRARVFAHINHLPMVTTPWWGIRWGVWFRNEKKKRLYWGYFKENNICQQLMCELRLIIGQVIIEPSLTSKKRIHKDNNTVFLFQNIITSNDLFAGLREHRQFLAKEIIDLLLPKQKIKLDQYPNPVISVHIRRGDFKISNSITPISFFIKAIRAIRKALKEELLVTIFTDANLQELDEILNEPNVSISESKSDILDILLMSRSKIIVLSQSSTFSYWAAFLSEALVVMSDNDWQSKFRHADSNKVFRVNNTSEGSYKPLINYLLHNKKIL